MTQTATAVARAAVSHQVALEAWRDAIAEWVKNHQAVEKGGNARWKLEKSDRSTYVPVSRNVAFLHLLDDPEALYEATRTIIARPAFVTEYNRGGVGWDGAIEQYSPVAVWEWLIMDRSADYAVLWTDRERYLVAQAVANTYLRRMYRGS